MYHLILLCGPRLLVSNMKKFFLKTMPNSILLTMKFISCSVSRFGVENKILLTDFLHLCNTRELRRFHVSGRSLAKATEL